MYRSNEKIVFFEHHGDIVTKLLFIREVKTHKNRFIVIFIKLLLLKVLS